MEDHRKIRGLRALPSWLDPAAVALLALAVRLAYALQYRHSPFFDFIHLDPLYFTEWARRIAGGEWIGTEVFEQAPLYPYLLAGYFKVFGEQLDTLRLIQFGFGAVTALLTCLLARGIFGRLAGLAAGTLAALYGPFLFFEGQVMKEFLTPFFSALMLLIFHRSMSAPAPRRWALLAASGACIGTAALVRDNVLLVLPCLALYVLFAFEDTGRTSGRSREDSTEKPVGGRDGLHRRRRIIEASVLVAGCLAVLSPVALRNYSVSGDLVMTTSGGGEVFYIGNGPYANGAYVVPPWVRSSPRYEHEDFRMKARELTGEKLSRAEASRFWWKEGVRSILDDPARWIRLELRKALLFLNDHELPDNYSYGSFKLFSRILGWLPTFGVVAGLAAAGLAASLGRWKVLLPLYLAGGSYMFSVMLFFNFGRFRLPFLPILFVFAGAGAVALARALASLRRDGRSGPGFGRAVALPLLAAAAWLGTMPDLHSSAEEPFQDRLHLGAAYRQAGMNREAEEILRETIRDAEAVLSSRGWRRGDSVVPGGLSFAWSLHAAHRDLAGVLLSDGRTEEAIREMQAAIPLDPNDAGLYQTLAGAYISLGRPEAAEPHLRRAVGLRPDSFTARFDLATALYESGRLPEALAELEEAKRRNPDLAGLDLADWHYGTGTILFFTPGREAEGEEHLREGLELNPDHPQADGVREILAVRR